MVCLGWQAALLPGCSEALTELEVRARTSASSMAVSPPPITTTGLSRYRKPSQVAQDEMPLPRNSYSPGTSSQFESAPVARMTAVRPHVPHHRIIRRYKPSRVVLADRATMHLLL